MAPTPLAAAYYLALLAGGVSLGKTVFSLASPKLELEGEVVTGYAALAGAAVLLLALLADSLANGLSAVASASGLFTAFLFIFSIAAVPAARLLLPAEPSLAPNQLEELLRQAEDEKEREQERFFHQVFEQNTRKIVEEPALAPQHSEKWLEKTSLETPKENPEIVVEQKANSFEQAVREFEQIASLKPGEKAPENPSQQIGEVIRLTGGKKSLKEKNEGEPRGQIN